MSQGFHRVARSWVGIAAVLLAVGLFSGASSPAVAVAEEAGPAIFSAQKCATCHSVSSLEIATTAKSDKIKVTDLSEVGSRRDAAGIRTLLEQKDLLETGKKHPKKLDKVSAEDLTALIDWLASLKKAS